MRIFCTVLEATPSHEVNLYHMENLIDFRGRQMTFTNVLIHRHLDSFTIKVQVDKGRAALQSKLDSVNASQFYRCSLMLMFRLLDFISCFTSHYYMVLRYEYKTQTAGFNYTEWEQVHAQRKRKPRNHPGQGKLMYYHLICHTQLFFPMWWPTITLFATMCVWAFA